MKLLLVADIPYPQAVNGISIYLHHLAMHLVESGVKVAFFCQKERNKKRLPRLYVSRQGIIRYYRFGPSPIVFQNEIEQPLQGLREVHTEVAFKRALADFKPDVVHFHEFVRTPVHAIHLARQTGAHVLVTLHDYWLLCPKLLLMTPDGQVCTGMDGGRNCVIHCLGRNVVTRAYRRIYNRLAHLPLAARLQDLRNVYKSIRGQSLRQYDETKPPKPSTRNLRLTGHISRLRKREIEMMRYLNCADRILAVSEAVARIFIKKGGRQEKLAVYQLGVPAASMLTWRRRSAEALPIRFGFMGHLGPCKGAHLLMAAIEKIPEKQAEFHFFGRGDYHEINHLTRLVRHRRNVTYHGYYHNDSLQEVLENFDVLIMPSVMEETLNLTGLEAMCAGIPVIGAEIGGIPDYVRHGVNGLLFRPRDAADLVRKIWILIQTPGLVAQLSQKTYGVATTMKSHAVRLVEIYREMLS